MNTALHTSSNLNGYNPLQLIALARQQAAQSQNHLQISCAKLDENHDKANPNCFAELSPMLLACIAAEGINDLYLETCKDCNKQLILSIMDDYKTLNQAMAVKLNVHFGKKMTEHVAKVAEHEPPRRTFFRTLIPSLAKHAAEHIQQYTPTTSAEGDIQHILDTDSRQLPAVHKLFLNALPKLQVNYTPVPVMTSLGLGNIQVSEACCACDKCVDTCASQALSLRKFGSRYILDFQADCCTGCNQCVSICPEQAIEALPSISLPSLIQQKPRPLVMIHHSS